MQLLVAAPFLVRIWRYIASVKSSYQDHWCRSLMSVMVSSSSHHIAIWTFSWLSSK